MEKMIPLNKQSKKAKKQYYARQRGSWHEVNPVTKVVHNQKAYDRNRAKRNATREGE